MSQHRIEEEANKMFEEYLESMKPSKFDKISGGVVGVGYLIDAITGKRDVRRNAPGNFDRFVTGQTQRREGRAQGTFLNQLRVGSAGREQERLGNEGERIRISQENLKLSQDAAEQSELMDLFDVLNKGRVSASQQSVIDANEALTAKRRRETELLGGGQTTAGTFNAIRGEVFQGFKQRELGRQLDAENPAFGRKIPAENFWYKANTPARFEPRQNIGLDEISIPADSLPALLQQTRQIAGGSQLTPATNLSNLGTGNVFPQPTIGLPPMIDPGDNEWGSANIDDWGSLDDNTKVRILEVARSRGALQ